MSELQNVIAEGVETPVVVSGNVGSVNVTPTGRKRCPVDTLEFISAWETAENVKGVIFLLAGKYPQIEYSTVVAKATNLRKAGIPLREFQKGVKMSDRQTALELLAKIRGTTVDQL